jgi:hypothetical protein
MGEPERAYDQLTEADLRARLDVLEAEVFELREVLARRAARRPRKFADLLGVFAGQPPVSDADLAAAEYHFEWEGETVR